MAVIAATRSRPLIGVHPWPEGGDGFSIFEGRKDNLDDGFLIMRNMLPSEGFDQAIQSTSEAGDEPGIMGEYLPRVRYFSTEEFEGLGCNPHSALSYDDM